MKDRLGFTAIALVFVSGTVLAHPGHYAGGKLGHDLVHIVWIADAIILLTAAVVFYWKYSRSKH